MGAKFVSLSSRGGLIPCRLVMGNYENDLPHFRFNNTIVSQMTAPMTLECTCMCWSRDVFRSENTFGEVARKNTTHGKAACEVHAFLIAHATGEVRDQVLQHGHPEKSPAPASRGSKREG